MSNPTPSMETTLQTAIARHRAGDRAEAERLYRIALAENPNDATAAFLTGVLALESGRLEAAVEMFVRATTIAPDNAIYYANLGEAERRLRRFANAASALLRALALKPDLAAPHYNLGLVMQEVGDADGALACFERAAELQPGLADVHDRIAAARKARRPGASSAGSMVELASVLAKQNRPVEGIAIVRRALEIEPKFAGAHWNLGNMLFDLGEYDEAIASFERALELDPTLVGVRANLAGALSRCGRLDEALAIFEQAVGMDPKDAIHQSNYVFQLHFSAKHGARRVLEEARRWDDMHGRAAAVRGRAHGNDRSPGRRLRIGYVSPDFRLHCQAFFLFPLLSSHDHEHFEIICYSDVKQPDDFTSSLMRYADQWRSIVGMDAAAVAAQIAKDRIDVLVDLTMHMADNRLLVFARKPAPVQISWLAYPGTTGLSAIDYRITDPFLDPPDSDTTVYTEQSLRVPDTFWCYTPLVTDQVDNQATARANGRVRFGSLNNFCKVNDAVLALWSRVLQRVEGSTLRILVPEGESRTRTLATFAKHGIDAERIEFVPRRSRLPYLAEYRHIDVCLDTFPYNGHTTSLDALWMGVPVVTLVGSTVVGRAGLSQAMNLGLPELVATTEDEYVAIAAALAEDLDRLSELHATLRGRMEASPLMDAQRFARGMEAAYRSAWTDWCARTG